jgi:predicted MFS family arabinose efflux permease
MNAALPRPAERQARMALALIFLVVICNYFDRHALGVLQVPIKADLGLSDGELGLLTGLAFFIPYVLVSIPIGRLADRYSRKFILAGALIVWSSMTALISVSQGFMLILILRMGVAIGEAACLPVSYSLLADYFPPERRARSLAIVGMAFPLGSSIGIAGAGFLAGILGWRGAFTVLGAVGLVLAIAMLLLMREPVRGGSAPATAPAAPPPPFGESMRMLWRQRALRYMAFGLGFQTYVASTVLSWSTPFYARVHGLELTRVAVVLGVITGVGGALGSYCGGLLSDRFAGRNQRWYLWVPALACALTVPVGLVQFLVPAATPSLGFAALTILLVSSFAPPLYAIAHSLVIANMRALISALLVVSSSILGGAFGPTVTGALSDLFLRQGAGTDALRYAICTAFVFSAAAAALFAKAATQVPAQPRSTQEVRAERSTG